MRRTRLSVAALALGLVLAAVALAARSPASAPRELASNPFVPVDASTLALSARLAAAPDLDEGGGRDALIPHERLPAVAATVAAQLPYPPGRADRYDWAAPPADPTDMGSITMLRDVQLMSQYRARCLWVVHWLVAQGADADAARTQATEVLVESTQWPGLRGNPRAPALARAAKSGDAATLHAYASANCANVS